MDMAFNSHARHLRRNNNSLQHANYLSLVPLNTRLPFTDPESRIELNNHVSYLENFQSPPSPSKSSRSPFNSSTHRQLKPRIPVSKSSSHLPDFKNYSSGALTSQNHIRSLRNDTTEDFLSMHDSSSRNKSPSDWILRAGAVMTSSARESKGQVWLHTRASSTSLVGIKENDDDWDHVYVRRGGYHGKYSLEESEFGDDNDGSSLFSTSKSLSNFSVSQVGSQSPGQIESRAISRRGSKSRLSMTSIVEPEDYLRCNNSAQENNFLPEYNDSVNFDVISGYDAAKQDELIIKNLARANKQGLGGWIEALMGWGFSAFDEDIDTMPNMLDEGNYTERSEPTWPTFNVFAQLNEVDIPPAKNDNVTRWQDAAWLMGVVAKVLI